MVDQMTVLEKAARDLCVAADMNPYVKSGFVGGTMRPLWFGFTNQARTALASLGMTPEQMAAPAGSVVVVPVELVNRLADVAGYFTPQWRVRDYRTPSTHAGAVYDLLAVAQRHGVIATKPGQAP